jgi:hypothetical protein
MLAIGATLLTAGCASQPAVDSELTAIQLASPSPSSTQISDEDSEPNSPVSDSFAELEFDDQAGDGQIVKVEEVSLSLGLGFVVITNQYGDILGYATATPDSQPVSVSLNSPVAFSQELIGILFLDNGDGEFASETDSRIRDGEGELIEEDFDYTYRKN